MKRILFPILAACLVLFTGAAGDGDILYVDIMYTSDIHGHIDRGLATFLNPNFPPPLGGGATAAAYIKKVREEAAEAGYSSHGVSQKPIQSCPSWSISRDRPPPAWS